MPLGSYDTHSWKALSLLLKTFIINFKAKFAAVEILNRF